MFENYTPGQAVSTRACIKELGQRVESLDKRITQLHTLFQELQGDLRKPPAIDYGSIIDTVTKRMQPIQKTITEQQGSPQAQEKTYTIPCAQAAEIVGLSHEQLYYLARLGDISSKRNATGHFMFNREDLEPLRIWLTQMAQMRKTFPAIKHIRLMRIKDLE